MIIVVDIPYLYHTTTIYNEKSEENYKMLFEEDNNSIEYVEKNKFPTNLNIGKYFTITPKCDWSSPWMNIDQVFLKYKVIKPMSLLYVPIDERGQPDCSMCDGFISYVDDVEVFLNNAADFVSDDYEIINFSDNSNINPRFCECYNILMDNGIFDHLA